MTLAHGRPYLAIPGPSVMPDRVLNAMHRAAPNIYEGELVEMVAGLVPDLKAVARTAGDVAIYIGNGHGAWEAAAANTLRPRRQGAGAGDRAVRRRLGRMVFERPRRRGRDDRFRQARAGGPRPASRRRWRADHGHESRR